MLKILFIIFILIPFVILNYNFWLIIFYFFFMSFIFIINYSINNFYTNISYFIRIDLLSYGLILLSFWICSLIIISRERVINFKNNEFFFIFNILFLLIILYLSFSRLNLFYFYIFFEIRLIPTLFLILGWGYQPERLQAGFYLLFYTLFASLPLLIRIFYIYKYIYSLFFIYNIFYIDSWYLYVSIIAAFLVKIPIFIVHLWLPKAHVEAPISGSIILAGVILKLGGYGLLRVINILVFINNLINYFIILFSLIGGLILRILCLRQIDIKSLIAYSSVVHIRIILGGLFTINLLGYLGSYCLIISHGLCSSGLFCLANIIYERSGSRNLFLNKGIINLIPSLRLWWFLLISSNMAAPPSLNLLGEIVLLIRIISIDKMFWFILILLSFFSVCYRLYLYTYSQHGEVFNGSFSFKNLQIREFLLLFLHWFPLNIIIIKSEVYLYWL